MNIFKKFQFRFFKMRKIYEFDKINNHNLWTKTIINKKDELSESKFILVPRWFSWCYLITLVFLVTILLSAWLILFNGKNPANYQESCAGRSCNKVLNMKCIDNVCSCTDSQYYLNKCYYKKSFGDHCSSGDQCKSYLKCIDGICQCNDTKYDDGEKCLPRKKYQEFCQNDQCLTKAMLTCDSASKKCVCLSNRFNFKKISIKLICKNSIT